MEHCCLTLHETYKTGWVEINLVKVEIEHCTVEQNAETRGISETIQKKLLGMISPEVTLKFALSPAMLQVVQRQTHVASTESTW